MPVKRRLPSTPRTALSCALFTALLGALPAVSQAQPVDELRLGVAVGSSDYGTALKAQLGQGFKFSSLPGTWRWEAQLTRFGSDTYQQFGNSYERNAWAAGVSALPLFPLTTSLSAYGKLGVHHLSAEASGPGLSSRRSDLKLGYGAGLRWQALPKLGLRLELENIGGSGGDLVTVGAEIPL